MPFSQIIPPSPSPRVQKTVLYICVSFAILHTGLSLPSFQIPYICISILYWCFSFWLTSLCIMGSSFIHLIRTDSNVFFLMAEWYSIVYMYHSFLFDTKWCMLSCLVVSKSLWPHGLQHAGSPCLSPTPRVYSNSCPLSRWCHSIMSFSVIPFSLLQSFPASGSFLVSQFFSSDGQTVEVSASASVLPMNTQDWSPLGWTGWISLQSNVGFRKMVMITLYERQQKRHRCIEQSFGLWERERVGWFGRMALKHVNII